MATYDEVSASLASIEGIVEAPSQFGHAIGFWHDGKEVAHLEGETGGLVEVEIRIGRKQISARRQELRADARVELRKNTSDWLTIGVRTENDVEDSVQLLRLAITPD